jgi:hypothetical protein
MKKPTLEIPEFKLPNLPKPVALALAAMAASAMVFLILSFTLGSARDVAEADVVRLRTEISTAQKNLRQSKEDYDFILANQSRFEALMGSDKLIPHTRRTAIRQMQSLALEFGLTGLDYNFQSAGSQGATAVSAQPKSGDYRVYVESISLDVGAALDQNIYSFIAAIHDEFPGSMVVSDFSLERPSGSISKETLNKVSRGEDSGLVKGKISYTWRTAQQIKEDQK